MDEIIASLKLVSLNEPKVDDLVHHISSLELFDTPVEPVIYELYNNLPSEIQPIWAPAQPGQACLGKLRLDITSTNAIREPIYAWSYLYRVFMTIYQTAPTETIDVFITEFKRCRAAFGFEKKRLSQDIVEGSTKEIVDLKIRILKVAEEYSRFIDEMSPIFDRIRRLSEKEGKQSGREGS
ncbi:hypothetical protein DRE_02942 [Drechslerella stenobrocha 248]|uniref:Uncharacterized protein n=1 Tax=Drechslerella stenobrocha 248 TaxID=1043628 RepID=W7I5J4_9PEZI|nr:hypothetical protein DRE_02942 [Drechslerella stenobrocha 248]